MENSLENMHTGCKGLTPEVDWLLVSSYNITLGSNVKVMRLWEMITNLQSSQMSNKLTSR